MRRAVGLLLALVLACLGTSRAVSAQIGPVDFAVDFHGQSAGSTITTTLLDSSTRGNGNHGGWGVTGTGLTTAAHVANCSNLAAFQVDGTTFAASNTSLSMAVDNTGVLRYVSASLATPTVGFTYHVALACFVINVGTPGGSGLWDLIRVNGSTSGAQIAQYSQSTCGGADGINLEIITAGTTNTACVGITQGTAYWIMVLSDYITGNAKLRVYDGATGVQVGSELTGTQNTSQFVQSADV